MGLFYRLILILGCITLTLQDEIDIYNLNKTIENDILNILNKKPVVQTYSRKNVFEEDVDFHLMTRKYFDPILINYQNIELIDNDRETKILIHGWIDNINRSGSKKLRTAYLKRKDVQILLVDWEELALSLYWDSVEYAKEIGKILGRFIVRINFNLHKVHILGHSLGAHIAGFAGKEVKKLTNQRINRITGMDPAGPWFEGKAEKERLHKNDAEFVDITHTSSGVFGFQAPLGTVDFYPNGGSHFQPGCPKMSEDEGILYPVLEPTELQYIDNLKGFDWRDFVFCSHTKSMDYFIDSIYGVKYKAQKCWSYLYYKLGWCNNRNEVIYGEDVSYELSGTYYFKTTNAWFPKETTDIDDFTNYD